ncbi:MAG: GNAT family N-acetyltransferase [Phycisphaerales bacterium]
MLEPVITTDRLLIDPPSHTDLDALAELWSDEHTMRYIGAGNAWSRSQIAERIDRAIKTHRQHGMTFWTIKERSTGMIIGQGGLVPIEFNGPEIELGYRLGKDHWGKGYATEIAKASARYGLTSLGLDELVAVCDEHNDASRVVLSKVGFREIGLSQAYYNTSTILHRMNRDDFERVG